MELYPTENKDEFFVRTKSGHAIVTRTLDPKGNLRRPYLWHFNGKMYFSIKAVQREIARLREEFPDEWKPTRKRSHVEQDMKQIGVFISENDIKLLQEISALTFPDKRRGNMSGAVRYICEIARRLNLLERLKKTDMSLSLLDAYDDDERIIDEIEGNVISDSFNRAIRKKKEEKLREGNELGLNHIMPMMEKIIDGFRGLRLTPDPPSESPSES